MRVFGVLLELGDTCIAQPKPGVDSIKFYGYENLYGYIVQQQAWCNAIK